MSRVTLVDVAKHAGVSRATASLVMRETGRVSEQTRARVRASMEDLGYVYHRGAASLRMQRTQMIGILVTDITNPFFAGMTVGIEKAMADTGYLTMLANTFDQPARQTSLMKSMSEHVVDGLVYVPVESGDDTGVVDSGHVPALAVTRRPAGDAPYLGPDDVLGGRLAAEHLLTHGRRRFVYLGGPPYASARRDRLSGLRAVLASTPEAKVVADVVSETAVEAAVAATYQLLDSGVDFDAVVCHSDLIAFGFSRTYRAAGRTIEEVSVIGFDGLPESAVFEPPLTTVAVGPAALGRRAGERIRDLLGGTDSGQVELMPPRLQVRESCGCH